MMPKHWLKTVVLMTTVLALPPAASSQGLFGAIVDQAKREAEARARAAVSRSAKSPPTTSTPRPAGTTAAAGGGDPSGTAGQAERVTPGYERYPAFTSFWPAPAPYLPPSQRSQTPTPVPPGTPDWAPGQHTAPMTAQGKPAWTYSDYELKTLTWGDALAPRGSAGLPEYAARNINNSPERQKWISTFDGWIRATYQPMGAVPIPFREIYPEKVKQPYIPLQYGVDERLYQPIVKNGRLTRTPSPHFAAIGVFANSLPGHDPAGLLNVPDQSYAFTMPYDRDLRLTVPQEAVALEGEAASYRRRIGIDATVYLTGTSVIVLLTRDGRLPVRQMTIGETLDFAEAAIRRRQVTDPLIPETYEKRLQGVRAMRERHARELNAPASLRAAQFRDDNFYGDDEVYGRDEKGATYPVYMFDPAVYAATRSGTPQWLVIAFPRWRGVGSWASKMATDQMADHFNFAYARDAIFHPELVAGRPYRPR